MRRKRNVRVGATVISCFVMALILLAGPANAFSVSLDLSDVEIIPGDSLSFVGQVEINSNENVDVGSVLLNLSGPVEINCLFYPNGTIISGCDGISIEDLSDASYGYGYGYGYGFTDGFLRYNFTLNSSGYAEGVYSSRLTAFVGISEFSAEGGDITIAAPTGTFEVISPTSGYYSSKNVLFNLTSSIVVDTMEYINWNAGAPTWIVVCSNCDSYSGTRSFKDGPQNLGFRAIKSGFLIGEENVSFGVDSTRPVIMNLYPANNIFASGKFELFYSEANPAEMKFLYGNQLVGYREQLVDINDCIIPNHMEPIRGKCNITADLSDYSEQRISYWAQITDIAGNSVTKNPAFITVDTIFPVINSISVGLDRKTTVFTFDVTEKNFDKISYIDNVVPGKEKSLCNSLRSNICIAKVPLKSGNYDWTIFVYDRAGNMVQENLVFSVA